MSDPTLSNVSDTALWVAVYRGREGTRPDALFQDPLALRLAGERGQQIDARMSSSQYVQWSVVMRTYIIDGYLQQLIASGVDTVINLGAGLDTRPYRMNLPPTLRWIEVDYPHIIQLKNEQLADEKPVCRLERIPVDLANDEARRNFLQQVGGEAKQAVILTEGVIPYLTPEKVALLAEELRRQKSFRFWIVDYYSRETKRFLDSEKSRQEMRNAPFQFFPDDWFAFFRQHGWKNREIRYYGEESVKLGRGMPGPWWSQIVMKLLPAAQKTAIRRYMGFVLLEPQE